MIQFVIATHYKLTHFPVRPSRSGPKNDPACNNNPLHADSFSGPGRRKWLPVVDVDPCNTNFPSSGRCGENTSGHVQGKMACCCWRRCCCCCCCVNDNFTNNKRTPRPTTSPWPPTEGTIFPPAGAPSVFTLIKREQYLAQPHMRRSANTTEQCLLRVDEEWLLCPSLTECQESSCTVCKR